MEVHLVDGTYELFRHYFAVPPKLDDQGVDIGAVAGVLRSVAGMLSGGATHLGVATDHVVESFRNDLYPGYKTSAGMDPVLLAQFWPLEEALAAMGVSVWAMVDQEADDGLAAAAALAEDDPEVSKVFICTPDKDLAQCVSGDRVVQLDRRKREVRNEAGVVEKFGVPPVSIPDFLALTGDSADGFPGLPGWGAKSAATVLACYQSVENIPDDPATWDVTVRGAARLGEALVGGRSDAMLFKDLATLRRDADVGTVESWRWTGVTDRWGAWSERLDDTELNERLAELGTR